MTDEPSCMAKARADVQAQRPSSAMTVMRLLWRIDELERRIELLEDADD